MLMTCSVASSLKPALSLLLALGCGDISSSLPSPSDFACGIRAARVETPPEGRCLRLDAIDGVRVRKLGETECSAWTDCVELGPGESGEYGTEGTEIGDGRVFTSDWACGDVPSCEDFIITPEGPVPR